MTDFPSRCQCAMKAHKSPIRRLFIRFPFPALVSIARLTACAIIAGNRHLGQGINPPDLLFKEPAKGKPAAPEENFLSPIYGI